MSARYCQQADVERAVGGAAQLVQLLDKDGDNVADIELVEQAIDAATNEIASYIQVVVDLSTLSAPYPFVLVSKTADIAAFHAWRYGAYGNPIPEHVVQGHEAAVDWAKDVGLKRATLGSTRKAGLDQPVGIRDHDPCGTGVSVRAFKRGFR